MPELSAGDAKLVQYLNEAYGLEKRLEVALQAHIAMTTKVTYKKRLKEHLSETKRHAREVKQRIKQLGGTAETVSAPGPEPITEVAEAVLSGAQKAVALAQGPLHALRGTGQEEKELKNAKTEYASESEEIATYTAIETLADTLRDKDTQRLARAIRREEERMRSFLEKEIPRLTKAVAKAEIPARRSPAGAKSASVKSGSAKQAASVRPASAKRAASAKTASAKRVASAKTASAKRAASTRTASAKRAASTRTASAKRVASAKTAAAKRASAPRSRPSAKTAVAAKPVAASRRKTK
jgi:ferritin-like metal-binding protein YciE